jgi:hypothetical protein
MLLDQPHKCHHTMSRPSFPYVVQPTVNGSTAFLGFYVNATGSPCAPTLLQYALSVDDIGSPGQPVTIRPNQLGLAWQPMLVQSQATMLGKILPSEAPLVFSATNAFLNQVVFIGLEEDSLGRLIWSVAPPSSTTVAAAVGLPAPPPPSIVDPEQFSLQPMQFSGGNLYYGRKSTVKSANGRVLRAFSVTASPGLLYLAWKPEGSLEGLPVDIMSLYTATGGVAGCASLPANPLINTFLA